jgi:O-antigen/teichoic acid export membrane protein
VLSVVAARYLGPDGMGRQSLIAFAGLSVLSFATAGLPPSLARYVGELLGAGKHGEALWLYRFTRRTEAAAALLSVGALAAVAALGGDPAAAWVLAGASAAFAVAQAVPSSLLTGAQRWREVSIAGLVCGIASLPITIVVLANGGGVTGLFAVEAAVALASLVWTSALARRVLVRLPAARRVESGVRRQFLAMAATATLLGAIHFVVWRRSELLVMQRESTDAQIAVYSIAFAIVQGLARVPEAIEAVTMPAVATLIGAGEQERVRAGFWRSLRVLALLTPVLVAGAAVTGPALIELAYGSDYRDAGPVLLVLLVPLALSPLFSAGEGVLFAFGQLRLVVIAGAAATVVDVGLALALIPSLDAIGAAIANCVAQFVAGAPVLVAVARHLHPIEVRRAALVRSLALAVLVAATAWAAQTALGGVLGIAAAVAVGAAAFALGGALVRPLDADDAEWAARAAGGRLGGLARRFGAP